MERVEAQSEALVNDAVDVLTKGIRSSDEKVAITSAVHILKTVGLYGEVKGDFGPTTPERERFGIRGPRKSFRSTWR